MSGETQNQEKVHVPSLDEILMQEVDMTVKAVDAFGKHVNHVHFGGKHPFSVEALTQDLVGAGKHIAGEVFKNPTDHNRVQDFAAYQNILSGLDNITEAHGDSQAIRKAVGDILANAYRSHQMQYGIQRIVGFVRQAEKEKDAENFVTMLANRYDPGSITAIKNAKGDREKLGNIAGQLAQQAYSQAFETQNRGGNLLPFKKSYEASKPAPQAEYQKAA